MSLGQAAPKMGTIAAAKGAGGKVFEILKRVSTHLYCLGKIGKSVNLFLVIIKRSVDSDCLSDHKAGLCAVTVCDHKAGQCTVTVCDHKAGQCTVTVCDHKAGQCAVTVCDHKAGLCAVTVIIKQVCVQ